MKLVAKYNIFKSISSLLTFGTPIITLLSCSDVIVHRSDTALSAAAVFTILILLFFMKDKLMEYFKAPSALIVASVVLVLILIVESILIPIKTICIATIITCGVDEVTFKAWYRAAELELPDIAQRYKHVGFIFASTNKIMEKNNGQAS